LKSCDGFVQIFCDELRASLGGCPGSNFTVISPPTTSSCSDLDISEAIGDCEVFCSPAGERWADFEDILRGELALIVASSMVPLNRLPLFLFVSDMWPVFKSSSSTSSSKALSLVERSLPVGMVGGRPPAEVWARGDQHGK